MKRLKFLFFALLLFSIGGCSATSRDAANVEYTNVVSNTANTAASPETAAANNQAQTEPPDQLVKDLYKTHEQKPGAIVQSKDRKIIDRYFDKNLGGMIWKDLTANQGEIGVIDFDIFYNTQDPDIKNLSVGAAKIEGDKATVPVTFQNYDRKENLIYSLVREKSGWRVSDIGYGGKDTLLSYFRTAKNAETDANDMAQSGEFEGKYQVGETTCTVTPVKMAFEVRWAKGSGAEMFYADTPDSDKITFSSSNPSGKGTPNVFSFDDENYNTGTFHRHDGVEFAVSRIK